MPVSGFHALLDLIPDRTRPKIAVIILTRLRHPNLFEIAKYDGAQACLRKQLSPARTWTWPFRRPSLQLSRQTRFDLRKGLADEADLLF